MAKGPNNKNIKKSVKKDAPMNNAMKFFLVGCVAELYLMLIQRFYVNAPSDIVRIVWFDKYLWVLMGVSLAVGAVGVIAALLLKGKSRQIGWIVAAAGVYAGVCAGLVRWDMSTMRLLMVLVPVVTALGIVWDLYNRECSLSLTVLGISLIVVWVCRRMAATVFYIKAAALIYIVLLVVLALMLTRKKALLRGAAPTLVYAACGVSILAVAAALLGTTVAYYAMWVMAAALFGAVVYFTIQQL